MEASRNPESMEDCSAASQAKEAQRLRMTTDERAALKAAYPEHAFLRVQHQLGEAIIAIPRKQSTDEKAAAVELWHGATVKCGNVL